MELRLFFNAILGDTVALVSGVGSVILLTLGLTVFFNKPTPRWIILTVAALCFFCAAARVWTAEHRKRLAAEQRLAELTKPKISGGIGNVTFGPAGSGNRDVVVLLEVVVYNTGAPTAIDNIAAVMKLRSGRTVRMEHLEPPKQGITAKGMAGQGNLWFPTDKYLPFAASKPIPTGGSLPGFVFGRFQGVTINEIHDALPEIEFTFNDVYGGSYTFTKQLQSITNRVDPSTLQVGSNKPSY
ncbi:MAG: hypothetical protein WBQ76_03370 [Candidatus Korobacteraceae bacterium]